MKSASIGTKISTIAKAATAKSELIDTTRTSGRHFLASPAARRIAKEKNLDLANIAGSGPQGSVRAIDLTGVMGTDSAKGAEVIPLSAIRRIVGERMASSKQTAPHFYLSLDIDMTAVVRKREEWKSAGQETIPSINDFIVSACSVALQAYPDLNASWAPDRIVRHRDINVGIAVALPDGLVVPVIRNADKLLLGDLALHSRELVQKAQSKKLLPSDYEGGTFTVSNLGMMGVDSFVAIINPPQAAILATGKVASRVVVEDDALAIRQVMTATLSVDHRVADGATAACFLQHVKQSLEQPVNDN